LLFSDHFRPGGFFSFARTPAKPVAVVCRRARAARSKSVTKVLAAHEIGHIRTGRFDDMLIEERRAWEWARANALVWTPTMEREADSSLRHYEAWTDDAHLAEYYYQEILAFVNDLLGGNDDGELVYDALVGNAAELAVIYENNDLKAARRVLIRQVSAG
jgi:hypothetical protein